MKKKNFSESDDGTAYEGFCIDLLNALKGKLQFEYELHLRSEIGERRSDGTWSGMIGELTRKVGDTFLLIKYYYMANPVLDKSLCPDWFFLFQDFAVRTVSMETVQSVYFCFGAKPANSTFATKTAKKKSENCYF